MGDVTRVEFKLWNGSSQAGFEPFRDEHLKQSTPFVAETEAAGRVFLFLFLFLFVWFVACACG